MKRVIFLLLLTGIFLVPTGTRAQATPASNNIDLVVSPPVPGPHTQVTAHLESSSIDLTQATISWKVDGKTVASGKGAVSTSFETGPLGSRTTVTANVSSIEGAESVSQTLGAASVDLMWQGRGYTPPFYEGRTLWGRQTQITFFAVPHVFNSAGGEVAPPQLVYRWSENGTVLGDSSGVGKNSLTIADSILGLPIEVKVDVMTDGSTIASSAEEGLAPVSASLFVYEDNPLYGFMFNREIDQGITITGQEITLSAFPYLFAVSDKAASSINYNWHTTGVAAGQTSESVTYRAPDNTSGSSDVTLKADSSRFFTQSAERDFLVQFGNQPAL